MSNEELIKHKIEVDEHITMEILIPKVMNALQFKGLTMKANKLFNLSEATNILPLQNNLPIKNNLKRKNIRMTEEQQIFLLRKFYDKSVRTKEIPSHFRKEYPETTKNDKAIISAIYNQISKNTIFYQQVLKENSNGENNVE